VPAGGFADAGIVDCTASPASSMPVPQNPPMAQGDPAGKSRDVPCRIDSACPGVRFGLRASISDTVPETSGAAKLVPIARA